MLNETALFSLNEEELRSEIEEASQHIQDITEYSCIYLHIFSFPFNMLNGRSIEPLAKIGCIDVEEYNSYDVYVIDYNIKLLRLLKCESIKS